MQVQGKDGKSFNLKSYRYPVPEGTTRKGIIVFVHGYGDYVGRYAYKGKFFAENGYDFVGID
jgi:alpha-beta hydrolase superfamily lysophospholipase